MWLVNLYYCFIYFCFFDLVKIFYIVIFLNDYIEKKNVKVKFVFI